MQKRTITIDQEFKDLCPKQKDEELQILRESLIKEGCREPIRVWDIPDYPIVDGMTRFGICTEEGIDFEVRYMDFADRSEARMWILATQLGRRNLTDTQRAVARGKLYNELKKDPAKNLNQGKNSKSPEKSPKAQNELSGSVAENIAAKEGVSRETVKRDGKLAEAVEKLTPATQTQIAGTKVENSKAELKRLADLPTKQQEKVARAIGSGKAKTVAEAKKVAKIPEEVTLSPEEEKVARAKEQVGVWADTVGRWLGKSPCIDEFREQWPGRNGDRVVKLAVDLYEALKKWARDIK